LRTFVYKHLDCGWTDFVEALGIAYPGVKKHRGWSREELLAEIRRWHAEGHPMNYKAVQRSYQALIHQARRFFGSWDAACAAAGVPIPGRDLPRSDPASLEVLNSPAGLSGAESSLTTRS
jgi:hypothetical protein